jgi:tetrapyrrole methylase family protein/MazG family protein
MGAVDSEGAVLDIWDDVKKAERASAGESEHKPGLLDSVPISLPALMQCQKISKRAAKAGFEWETVADVWDQVASERREFEAEERGSAAAAEEFGDLLFALVNVARHEGIDAEEALATSNRKFRRRWAAMEEIAFEQGFELDEVSTERLNELWDAVKAQERAVAGR